MEVQQVKRDGVFDLYYLSASLVLFETSAKRSVMLLCVIKRKDFFMRKLSTAFGALIGTVPLFKRIYSRYLARPAIFYLRSKSWTT